MGVHPSAHGVGPFKCLNHRHLTLARGVEEIAERHQENARTLTRVESELERSQARVIVIRCYSQIRQTIVTGCVINATHGRTAENVRDK